MYKAQVVRTGLYDDRGYSNEQSMAALMLTKADRINKVMTYTMGYDDDRFPLTFLTEGQSGGTALVNDVQFTWDFMGRQRYNDMVVKAPVGDRIGYGNTPFYVWFKTRLLIEQYGIIGPNGEDRCRIMEAPVKDQFGYRYTLVNKNPDPNAYIDPAQFAVGAWWSMTAPSVPESYSRGNRSNVMAPGKMRGQIGFHRFSKEIGGNLSNKVVEYQFKTKGGGTTNLWINEEMRQFDVTMRLMREEAMWLSRYNRRQDGEIIMKDFDNDNPIPESAGVLEIVENSNYDTYGDRLYLEKLDRTIGDVLVRDTDYGAMEITLYGGKGFINDFNYAITSDAKNKGYSEAIGDKIINGTAGALTYGGRFTQYITPDGHRITVKHLPICDNGTLAENDRSNGNIHPRTNLPMSSHMGVFLDHSSYSGERNIKMAQMKGQSWIAGVLKGLAPIPASWGTVPQNSLGTDVDASRYEVKMSSGINISNSSRCFLIKSVL